MLPARPFSMSLSRLGQAEEGWEFVDCLPDTTSAPATEHRQKRKHKHGSLLDLAARRHLPKGPESLQELFNFPSDMVRQIFADPERAKCCANLLKDGVVESSDYSGIAAEFEAKRLILQVLREEKSICAEHFLTKTCDIDVHCQRALGHMSHMLHNAQTCVFADIREQIHVNAQRWCASMDPAFGGTGRELDRLPLEELESRYTAIREFLAKNGKWAVDQDRML